jgi:hypothetical protein
MKCVARNEESRHFRIEILHFAFGSFRMTQLFFAYTLRSLISFEITVFFIETIAP